MNWTYLTIIIGLGIGFISREIVKYYDKKGMIKLKYKNYSLGILYFLAIFVFLYGMINEDVKTMIYGLLMFAAGNFFSIMRVFDRNK